MTAVGHFGCPRLTFDHISGHFRSIRIFFFFYKMAVRNSLFIAFLAISDRCTSIFFKKQNDVGHFGCPKLTFDHISGHFRSIRNFFYFFFTKWLPAAILDVRNSLSIAFLAISDRYTTLFCFGNFWQNGCRRPFLMSEIHFRWHFWPF